MYKDAFKEELIESWQIELKEKLPAFIIFFSVILIREKILDWERSLIGKQVNRKIEYYAYIININTFLLEWDYTRLKGISGWLIFPVLKKYLRKMTQIQNNPH